MVNDIVKYFNTEEFFWTNQQAWGVREIFRGVVVKSWVAMPVESIKFKKHNKILIKKAVEFYSKCWKERCNVLHSLECRKQRLNKEIKGIKTESMKGAKMNYNSYVKSCPTNEETKTIESMRVWIWKAILFKENAGNSKQ